MKNQIQKEIIEVSKKLISFRSSELYPSEKKVCLDYIDNYFKSSKNNFTIQKVINNECAGIVISNTNSKKPDLLLNGHVDVVEGNDKQFKPTISKNRLYGRGAIDMKASVATMMVLLKRIVAESINEKIALMIVADEEIPSGKSTGYLLDKLKLKPSFTIVGEETGFDIVTEQKGNLNIIVKTTGKASHSAFPEKGINAIDLCLALYRAVNSLSIFKRKVAYKNTIALTCLKGGQAINAVPDLCEMGINIRITNTKDLKQILNIVNRYKRKVEFSIQSFTESFMTQARGYEKEILRIKQLTKNICGIESKVKKTATGSDTKYFSERKLPVIMFGPVGKNYHENNEYVEIKSLNNYYKILYQLINK